MSILLKNNFIEASENDIHVEIVSKTHGTRWAIFDRHVLVEFSKQFGERSLFFNSTGYIQFRNGSKVILMNTWLKTNFDLPGNDDPLNVEVDHLSGSSVWEKKLDNRLSNLRLVTSKENNKNRKNKTSIYDLPEPFPGAWYWKPIGIGYIKPRGTNGLCFVYQDSRTHLKSTSRHDVPDIDKLLEVVCLAIVYGNERHRAALKTYCQMILNHM